MKRRLPIILSVVGLSFVTLGTAWATRGPKLPPSADASPTPTATSPTVKSPKVDVNLKTGSMVPATDLKLTVKLKPKGYTGEVFGQLAGVETDAKGIITALGVLDYESKQHWVDGCGASLTDLPQIGWSHHIEEANTVRYGVWLRVSVNGGCLARVRAERSWWYRND